MNMQWANKATTVAVLGCAGVLALGGVASAEQAPPIGHAVTQDDPNPNPEQGRNNGSDDAGCTKDGDANGPSDGSGNGDAGTDDPNAMAQSDDPGPSDNCAPADDGNAPTDTPDNGADDAGPGTGPGQ